MALIENVQVRRWKHFEFDKPLVFKPGINLVLGKNGSGKTSLLRMISDASVMQNQSLNGPTLSEADGTHLVTITLKSDGNDISVTNQKSAGAGVWSSNALKDQIRFITSQRSISSGNTARNPLAQQLGDTTLTNPGQTIDVAEEFHKAIIKELYDKVVALSGDISFLDEIEKDYQKELVDFEKTLKIDPKKENAVYFLDYKEQEVSVGDLSSGEQEYLYFYSFLRRIQSDDGKVILIDEPELHLHSSQIRKLCELIANLAIKNQIVIATHSGEVLQHFISRANIILLRKGKVDQIDNPEQMRKVLEETGLPIDPSVFTSHWICAENEPSVALYGGGATTPEVLSWIFGKDLNKRYWSFGSNREVATKGYGGGISSVMTAVDIKVTPILDGDKLMKNTADYFPPAVPVATKELAYFPFWELENIFLIPELLNTIVSEVEGKNGDVRFWEKVEANKGTLLSQIKKTVAKSNLRQFNLDSYITTSPQEDIERWKKEIQESELDLSSIDTRFDEVISTKKWQWLPGKEAFKIVLELEPLFWSKIRELQQNGELGNLLETDPSTGAFIKSITSL